MKLSPAQIRALEFLSLGPWEDSWWGCRPLSGWPEELRAVSYRKLHDAGLAKMEHGRRFSKKVVITADGKAALKAHKVKA